MRQSQWNRMVWSKLAWCWLSLGIMVLLLVWHSGPGVALLQWDRHEHSVTYHHDLMRSSTVYRSGANYRYPTAAFWEHRHPETKETPLPPQPDYLIHSEDPSATFSAQAHYRARYNYMGVRGQESRSSAETDGDDNDDATAIEDPDSAEQQQQQQASNNNPAVYGWTPDAFPNPMTNPIRCAIAYLPQFMDHPPADSSVTAMATNNNNNSTQEPSALNNARPTNIPDNGQMLSPLQLSPEQELQQQQEHPLRLCDPDWVLGGVYLEQVAFAMQNFTQVFGKPATHDENSNNDNGGIEPPPGIVVVPDEETQSLPWVDLAIATARKMDLQAVLQGGAYFAYEDDDDMVNDAAQLFARGLHDFWWPTGANEDDDPNDNDAPTTVNQGEIEEAAHGILFFLSIQDRVCFISTGSAISSVLPWWRLDHIVSSIKPALRDREYGKAVLLAIQNLSAMLDSGPPSFADRMHDFCARFGVVILFATFTFFFGAWGEYRDRRKRFQYAEERSQFKGEVDREKAKLLQQGYNTRQCPICLESFCTDKAAILSSDEKSDVNNNNDYETVRTCEEDDDDDSTGAPSGCQPQECKGTGNASIPNRNSYTSLIGLGNNNSGGGGTDSYGIPMVGADGKRIKLLRCGHIFCETCWQSWVHSGCGNPCNCPVCRQDIGKAPRQRPSYQSISPLPLAAASTDSRASQNNDVEAGRSPSIWRTSTHPTYDSVAESRLSSGPSRAVAAGTNTSNQDGNSRSDEDRTCSGNERQPLLSRS